MSRRWPTHPPKEWLAVHEEELIKLYESGLNPRDIAPKVGRTVASVAGRLTKLRGEDRLGPPRGHGGRAPRSQA